MDKYGTMGVAGIQQFFKKTPRLFVGNCWKGENDIQHGLVMVSGKLQNRTTSSQTCLFDAFC